MSAEAPFSLILESLPCQKKYAQRVLPTRDWRDSSPFNVREPIHATVERYTALGSAGPSLSEPPLEGHDFFSTIFWRPLLVVTLKKFHLYGPLYLALSQCHSFFTLAYRSLTIIWGPFAP